jgi:hypothetical protein
MGKKWGKECGLKIQKEKTLLEYDTKNSDNTIKNKKMEFH